MTGISLDQDFKNRILFYKKYYDGIAKKHFGENNFIPVNVELEAGSDWYKNLSYPALGVILYDNNPRREREKHTFEFIKKEVSLDDPDKDVYTFEIPYECSDKIYQIELHSGDPEEYTLLKDTFLQHFPRRGLITKVDGEDYEYDYVEDREFPFEEDGQKRYRYVYRIALNNRIRGLAFEVLDTNVTANKLILTQEAFT